MMKGFITSFVLLSLLCFNFLWQAVRADVLFTVKNNLLDAKQLDYNINWKNKGSLSPLQVEQIEKIILNGLYKRKNAELKLFSVADMFAIKIGVRRYNFACEIVFAPPFSVVLAGNHSRCSLSSQQNNNEYVLSIQ